MLWAGVCGGEIGVRGASLLWLRRGLREVPRGDVYAHGEGNDVFCDYGIILKKCDNVQVCACVGVGNGIKYARNGAGCFAARI